MNDKGKEIFQKGRFFLSRKFPYLETLIYNLIPIACKDVEIAGVGKNWNLYLNYNSFEKFSVEESAFVILHELMHLLKRHFDRIGARDFIKWAISTDLEINSFLSNHFIVPKYALLPRKFNLEDKLIAEEYYEKLPEGLKIKIDLSSGVVSKYQDYERISEDDQHRNIEKEKEILVNSELSKISKNMGNIPDFMKIIIEEAVKRESKVNWRNILYTTFSRILYDSNSFIKEISLLKPSRKNFSINLANNGKKIILPGKKAIAHKVAVILDTSGSISREELGAFIEEIKEILKRLRSELFLVSCDCKVHNYGRLKNASDIDKYLIGGGGTDLTKAFEVIPSIYKNIIVMTDGYTTWPDYPKGRKIVVLMKKDFSCNLECIPKWCQVILI